MKLITPILHLILNRKITKYLVEDEVVMNWSILKKCILMLILGAAIHFIWIIWKVFVLLSPQLYQWVNIPLIKFQLGLNASVLILLIVMIYPCYAWSHRQWVKLLLPYFAIGLFVISLCWDGYIVGTLSPATMTAYVSLVTVGLVLFPRVIVYSMFVPATLFLTLTIYLSYADILPYAPLFQNMQIEQKNSFWLLSMSFYIVPILFTCLVLFEILLSQWRHREHLIEHLSQIDPLTNLFNRRSINQCLERLNSSNAQTYALILMDLDHFKTINDRFGHHKGDEALVKVSEILSLHLRESDVVGRFGGEEFILVLRSSSLEQAQYIAERCRKAIQQLEFLSDEGELFQITASFGISLSTPELRPQQLLSQADKALYEAKACGRNLVKAYNTKMQTSAIRVI